jgi:hypothetical protein
MRHRLLSASLFAVLVLGPSAAWPLNGFDLRPASIPAAEILPGGPPRDGIPALDAPHTVSAQEAPWKEEEMVIGVTWNGEARAYPLAVLVWHELVNDSVGGRPILVSYCPLCGTGIVFDRRREEVTLRFGVSGLLYKSDLLMFDRETESLWSQIEARAVTGPRLGQRLSLVRSRMEPWGRWKAAHPATTVLSTRTGHERPYGRAPYGDYADSERLVFPVSFERRYHPKMPVVGLRLPDGPARVYPAEEVRRAGGVVEESFEGRRVRIRYEPDAGVFRVSAPDDVEVIEGYWFAWSAFHPESDVFAAPD